METGRAQQTIIIKPTHRCNLDCPFCYDRFKRSENKEIMPIDKCIYVIEKVLHDLPDKQNYHIIWHGGEPMMLGHDYVRTVCEHFRDRPEVYWSMQSNLTLMDDEWGDIIRRYAIGIGGSWDGICITELNSHNTKYIEHAAQYVGGLHVLYTVTPWNCDDLIASYLWASGKGYELSFNAMFGEEVTKEDYEKIAIGLAKFFDFLCGVEHANVWRPFDDLIGYIQGELPTLCEKRICAGYWYGIDEDGTVTSCGKPWPAKAMSWGNVFDPDFNFNKIPEQESYKIFKQNLINTWRRCQQCPWTLICNNGCPFGCYDKDGNYTFNEEFCHFKKILIPAIFNILKHRCEEGTLVNRQIINALHATTKIEWVRWRNYEPKI